MRCRFVLCIMMLCHGCVGIAHNNIENDARSQGPSDPGLADIKHVRVSQWPLAITTSNDDNQELLAEYARRVGRIVGANISFIVRQDRNPVCAIWIEIDRWTPNPGEPGYSIFIQPGGMIVRASNAQQMELALERLGKMRRVEHDAILMPVGVATNYPIIDK